MLLEAPRYRLILDRELNRGLLKNRVMLAPNDAYVDPLLLARYLLKLKQ